MKKFLKNLTLFCVILIPVYVFVLGIYGYIMPAHLLKNMSKPGLSGFTFSKFQDVEKYEDVDILVVGSSHAYRSIDTRNFDNHGIKVFNFGTSAQSPFQSRILLEKYVDKLKPKMVLFEVRPAGFSSDGVESAADIISTDKFSTDYIDMALETNHIKVYNTLIYSALRSLFNLDSNFKEEIKVKDDTYITGGFVSKEILYNKPKPLKNKSKYEFSEMQMRNFEQALNFLNKKNIPFILIQAPITSNRYNNITNNEKADSYFKKFGVYYNFNEILKLNDTTDFFDDHHLNQNGANQFNARLIKMLNLDKVNK